MYTINPGHGLGVYTIERNGNWWVWISPDGILRGHRLETPDHAFVQLRGHLIDRMKKEGIDV
jgi:hypothetical protein